MLLVLVGAFLACATMAWTTNSLALRPWRRSIGAHWTERARLLFPVRCAAAVNLYLIPINAVLAFRLLAPDSGGGEWLAVGFAAWLGTIAAGWPFDQEIMPWLAWPNWRVEVTYAWVFRFLRWFILVCAMAAVPDSIEWSAWIAAAAVIGVQALQVWGGGLWLCRRLGLLKPAPESLRRIVLSVADKAGVQVRGIWTLRSAAANAIAIPHTRDIAVTERTLEHCPPDEITAICAHEIGHLAETKGMQLWRFLGSLAWVPWVFLKPLWNLYGPVVAVVLGVVTWTIFRLTERLSHKLETHADAAARQHEPDEGAFARALARLYELNQVPAVLAGKRHSHPHLYDRLLAAGVTPEYPRPQPAEVLGWPGYVQSTVLGLLIVASFKLPLLG